MTAVDLSFGRTPEEGTDFAENFMDDADQAIMEDASGRININASENFKISEQVTGTIVALLGIADASGYFNVIDKCVAGIPFKAELPKTVKIEKRSLFDDDLLRSNDRKFIALTSGMNFPRSFLPEPPILIILLPKLFCITSDLML